MAPILYCFLPRCPLCLFASKLTSMLVCLIKCICCSNSPVRVSVADVESLWCQSQTHILCFKSHIYKYFPSLFALFRCGQIATMPSAFMCLLPFLSNCVHHNTYRNSYVRLRRGLSYFFQIVGGTVPFIMSQPARLFLAVVFLRYEYFDASSAGVCSHTEAIVDSQIPLSPCFVSSLNMRWIRLGAVISVKWAVITEKVLAAAYQHDSQHSSEAKATAKSHRREPLLTASGMWFRHLR